MKSKEEIKKYFENGDKPTQEQFWEWQDSYWHKDEKLPADKIDYNFSEKADLIDGKVPASQLPSQVNDVIEFTDLASFPVVGEFSKLYVALNTNKLYRWSGSTYVDINQGDFVPLSGTETDKPVTGDIELDNESKNIYIKGKAQGSYISFYDDGVISINGTSGSNVDVAGIDIYGKLSTSKGIEGSFYYGDNYLDNSFVQAKYVNDNFLKLSGTETNKPITGHLEFENFKDGFWKTSDNKRMCFSFQDNSFSVYAPDDESNYAKEIQINPDGGISSTEDYSGTNNELAFVQKKYIDDNVNLQSVLNGGNSATDTNSNNYIRFNYNEGVDSRIEWELYNGVNQNAFFQSTLNSIYYNNNNSDLGYSSEVNIAYDTMTFQVNKIDSSLLSTVRLTAENALEYNDDYSARFTDRSLIDKGYVNDNFLPLQGTSTENPITGNVKLQVPSRSSITIGTEQGSGLEFHAANLVTLTSGTVSGRTSYFSVSSNYTTLGYSSPDFEEKRILLHNTGIFIKGLEETTDDLKYVVVDAITDKVSYKTLFGKATLPNMMSIGELETSEVFGNIRWQSQGDYAFIKLELNGYIGADDNVSFDLTGLSLKGASIVKTFLTNSASTSYQYKDFVIDAGGSTIRIRNIGTLSNVQISEVLTFEVGVDAPAR